MLSGLPRVGGGRARLLIATSLATPARGAIRSWVSNSFEAV